MSYLKSSRGRHIRKAILLAGTGTVIAPDGSPVQPVSAYPAGSLTGDGRPISPFSTTIAEGGPATYVQAYPQGTLMSADGRPVMAIEDIDGTLGGAAPGVFFDSAAGDTFDGPKVSLPADATLTPAPGSVAFSSAAVKALDLTIKRQDGSILDLALDDFTVKATFALTSFPAVDTTGAYIGSLNDILGLHAGELHAHPASATQLLDRIWNAGNNVDTDATGIPFAPGDTVDVTYHKSEDLITVTTKPPAGGGADHVRTINQVFAATGLESPREFSKPLVRFVKGIFSLTGLKVSAANYGSDYAFVGDSLTQGRLATAWGDGYATQLRHALPGTTLISGAPSATTHEYLVNIQDVIAMAPKRAFLLLGTNDLTVGRTLAATQTDYTANANALIAAGITPVAVSLAPRNDIDVTPFNTWLAAQGWLYVDIFTPLKGAGTGLSATYDAGDGLHWNTLGHSLVKSIIGAFIDAHWPAANATVLNAAATNKPTIAAFTNNNRTIQSTAIANSVAPSGVYIMAPTTRSLPPASKAHVEVHIDNNNAGNLAIAIWAAGFDYSNVQAGDGGASVAIYRSGAVNMGLVQVGTGASFTTGDDVTIEVNLATWKLWFKVGNGTWNNSGPADPATGVGGIDISALNTGGNVFLSPCLGNDLHKQTWRFSAPAMAHAISAGYSAFDLVAA